MEKVYRFSHEELEEHSRPATQDEINRLPPEAKLVAFGIRMIDMQYFRQQLAGSMDTDACMGNSEGWVQCCNKEWIIPQMCEGGTVKCVGSMIRVICPNPNCPTIEFACGHSS